MSKPMEDLLYKMVGNDSISMTTDEMNYSVQTLNFVLDELQTDLYMLPPIVDHIFKLYFDKISDKKSVAKLSADYNTSITGLNKTIKNSLHSKFHEAKKAYLNNDFKTVVDKLKEARISPLVYYNIEVRSILKDIKETDNRFNRSLADNALDKYDMIENHQDKLVKSITRMVSDIVKAACKPLSGNVISYPDMLQEGLYAAYDTVLKFNPHRDTKFSSYAYVRISAIVSKYIAENTRTVNVPRSVIEKYDKNDDEANLFLQQEISLDIETQNSKEISSNKETVMGDYLEASGYTPEEEYERRNITKVLKGIIQNHCANNNEYETLVLRWGLNDGELKSVEEAANLYKSLTGVKMNKGKLSEIERRVFSAIRSSKDDNVLHAFSVIGQLGESL